MVSGTARRFWKRLALLLGMWVALGSTGRGELVTADWLPADVKFHFSIANYPESKPLFDQTGFGQLLADESMRPFLKDIPNQLRSRARTSWFGFMWVDLGIDWDQFAKVPSGELAWTVFKVDNAPAAVLFANVAGKDDEVEKLRGDITAAMEKQNVSPETLDVNGTKLTVYRLPKRGEMAATTLVHFIRNDWFVATRHLELAKELVPRIGAAQPDNLTGLSAYQYVLGECRKASKQEPHAALYMVPFDCLEMANKVAEEKNVDVQRSPEVYRSQGFDALSAVGATILYKQPDSDFSFYISLYAPKPWSRSMQMVDLRNGVLQLPNWVDQKGSSCSMLNLHAPSVYGNLGPFFDEVIAGAPGTWKEILADLRDAEDGPHLDLEQEILTFMSGPATVIEKEALPVTPESPQVLLAIKANDEPALRAGIKKAMHDDPFIEKKEVGSTICYYSMSQENAENLLWIIAVARGHLFMANDFAILTPILLQETGSALAEDPDFEKAQASWKEDLSDDASTITFYHLDRWTEVRYELLRTGKKVAARRSLSGMLSAFLGGEVIEEETSEFDGSKLPPFDQVRKYLGTFEAAAVTVDKGWLISGHVR